jgi:cytochrome b561
MASWLDTPQRYGRISRGFHWLMAALFVWQFAGALLFVSIGDTALTKLVGGSHLTLGFTLFVLVLLRGTWALVNLRRRPPHPGSRGRAAVAGHALIYAVMIVQPAIALLRQYGSGKPFSPYGIPVMSERPYKIEWMTVPADVLHYWLGFAFLLVLIGHVTMTFVHQRVWHEDVLSRMK